MEPTPGTSAMRVTNVLSFKRTIGLKGHRVTGSRWLALVTGVLLFTAMAGKSPGPVAGQGGPPDPRFGVVEAFWDPQAAAEANVGWERILFYWSHIQPTGPDDWNTLHVPDEWLQAAQSQGREVVGVLKNTPAWATDMDPPLEASPPKGLDLPIDDPENLWAQFVRMVVAHYGQRGVHRWVIWNEPDIRPGVYGQEWSGTLEQYYRLLKVASLAAREADPAARIHLAGITFWHDPTWLRSFLAVATADPDAADHGLYFDVVSLHVYFQTDTVDYIVNEARAALALFGLSKPIWINETNASPDSDPLWPMVRPRWRVDLQDQASFIVQAFALGLAAGCERIGVYKLVDTGLPPGGEPFGLLRSDHSRRPAYSAFQVVTQYLAGTRAARVMRSPLWTQVTLEQENRVVRVFWARTAADVTVAVPGLSGNALLVDQQGETSPVDAAEGAYRLHLAGARCADEVMGCIIGGPTLLLVEDVSEISPVDAQTASEITLTPETMAVSVTPSPPSLTMTVVRPATAISTVTGVVVPEPTLPPTDRPLRPSSTTRSTQPGPAAGPSAAPSPTATILPPDPTPIPTGRAESLQSDDARPGAEVGPVIIVFAAAIIAGLLAAVHRGRRPV